MRFLVVSALFLGSSLAQMPGMPGALGRGDTVQAYLASYQDFALSCAAQSTGDLETRLAAAFDTCQANSQYIPDIVDECPSLDDIEYYSWQLSYYLDCIETELGWDNALNVANDMAAMPEAVSEAMNSQEEDSAINQCVPNNMALIQTWAEGCGYDPEATGVYFGKTLKQMMEAYVKDTCVPYTFLGACSNLATA